MAEVHESTNNVYESFVDKDYEGAKLHTQKLNQTSQRRYTIIRR